MKPDNDNNIIVWSCIYFCKVTVVEKELNNSITIPKTK